MKNVDRTRTLEQLEKDVWPHNSFDTYVVQESQSLRRIPIGELSVEDLRLLIGQGMGLPFLVPLALDVLSENPFAHGARYPGDLLASLLKVPDAFWEEHPELNNDVVELAADVNWVLEFFASNVCPVLARFTFR